MRGRGPAALPRSRASLTSPPAAAYLPPYTHLLPHAMNAPVIDADRDRLRAELESIEGVRRAVIDGVPPVVYLLCDRLEGSPVELLARAVLLRHGYSAVDADLQLCFFPAPQAPRRVRLVEAELAHSTVGRATASVALEWGGRTYRESVEGESGPGMELRLAAQAAVQSLEALIGGALRFRLVGVKSIRAFDADLVVVLLRTEDASTRSLLGSAIVGESAAQAVTRAVLSATNRILGNYLDTGE